MIDSTQLDHCAFVVPNLDATVDFFTNWLGFNLVGQKGPVQSPNDDLITRTYTMPKQGIGRWAYLQKGSAKLGFVEWNVYGAGINPLRESSVPGCCIALRVDDLAGTIASLRNIPRMNFMEPSNEGFVYAITPYGFQLQLIQAGAVI
jgi:catechol 2,3-dioxygenase-like lactoylglutathione lyase family enzyme